MFLWIISGSCQNAGQAIGPDPPMADRGSSFRRAERDSRQGSWLTKIPIQNLQFAYSATLSVYLPFENQRSSNADMNITLNNEPLTTEGESITVARLLELKKYTFKLRIVKINGRLISRDSYDEEVVRDGDDVQVIYLMSGG
jgi:sulfur carrier protein